ncbi:MULTISPECIES: 4-oxalomesaconate tautomerase [Micrococcaceae]|uniref:4-oxalomesaconate tautomerase n=1 Tax=unclassified Kocuria TaxID=2649579 RepID=UPI001EE03126|nr:MULTISPECIES: 4-oxalomesaconate tautomerase [unclassified Kocuria]
MTIANVSKPVSGSQTVIPTLFMRGGTSRGPFFYAPDLPTERELRDRVLAAVMGSPHPLQVDGIGGGHPLTSKVGIVSASHEDGVDLDFTFAQLQPGNTGVQTTANCGNMLSAVVPYALETGLITPADETTTAVVRTLNTGLVAEITVHTPRTEDENRQNFEVAYEGDTAIDGVGGTASPIEIMFRDTEGSVASALLPTGNERDTVVLDSGQELETTMIDNGQPMVLIRAGDVARSGYEDPTELNEDAALKALLEELRLKSAERMGLGDVRDKSYPKMTLIAEPRNGGALSTRCFIPHVAHESIGVLAAVTVATAACMDGSVVSGLATPGDGLERVLSIEHPSGEFLVDLELSENGHVQRAGITRTARLLMSGHVYVPQAVWNPADGQSQTEERTS